MAISPPLPKVSSPIPPLSPAPPVSALQREPQAAPPRRSQRAPKPVTRLIDTLDANKKSYVHTAALGLHYAEAMEQEQFNLNCLHVLKAAVSDPDTLTYDEILQDSELVEWKKAATNAIASLEEKGTWEEVSIDQAQGTILPGTWVFRRKRAPTGHVIKHKARYCVRGDLQEVHDDTFTPVVAWSTICMVLVFAVAQDWPLICVDFSNAFVQATLNSPVWIHLPRGYKSTKSHPTCLRLKKSLYGLVVAPKLCSEMLFKAFRDDEFAQSENDPCLFLKPNMVAFTYVDDCGIATPTMKEIDGFVDRLRKRGFELTKEGDFSAYLGINFHRDPKTQTVTMTQPGLIKKILATTRLEECNPNRAPSAQAGLGADPNDPPGKEPWSYSSVVGMLLYLATNTRPDIAFAVSQVVRFNSVPKQSHAAVVKMIVRYMKGTTAKGTIFKPTGTYKVVCYMNADFAGLHGRDPQEMPTSACSCTGYIMFFGGCPLLWKSQLQTETALSTFHTEYVALAAAMHQLIVVQRVLQDLAACLLLKPKQPKIHATVHEDNASAHALANNQRLSDQSKSLNTKYHFFWEWINGGMASMVKCSTDEQQANYMTKGLVAEKFESNRKKSQGW